jgi:hypothetical protein
MNNSFYRLIFLAILLLSLGIHVEANDLVQFPSGPAAWTIEIGDSSAKGATHLPAGLKISRIEVTQNADYLRSVTMFSDNTSDENWSIRGSSMFITEDSRGTPFITSPTSFSFVPLLPSSFDWIQPGFLQEQKPIDYQGKQCFHYKGTSASSPSRGVSQTATVEAWIDSTTLLPVAMDDGNYLATFTFLPAPTTPLVLPPKYKSLLDAYKHTMGIPKT